MAVFSDGSVLADLGAHFWTVLLTYWK